MIFLLQTRLKHGIVLNLEGGKKDKKNSSSLGARITLLPYTYEELWKKKILIKIARPKVNHDS